MMSYRAVCMCVWFAATSWSAPCDSADFYSGLDTAATGTPLRNALRNLVGSHNVIPYTSSATDCWDALNVLEQDPADALNVTLVYSLRSEPKSSSGLASGWNREHVWPKSYGVGYSGADTSDLHSLRAADWGVNSARNNLYFDNCPAVSCTSPAHGEAAPGSAKDSLRFQPPASERGDLARSLFYMATRYDGADSNTENLELSDCPCSYTFTMGKLSTLLQWHVDDPPDAHEIARTAGVCAYQGNRNPFVDYPAFAAAIFTADADTCGSSECTAPAASSTASSGSSSTPTLLEAGDVQIVGINSDNPDQVVLVSLVALVEGTQLFVTDCGWFSDGGFRTSEGSLVYTVAEGGLQAGEIISWTSPEEDGNFDKLVRLPALSATGDSLFVSSAAISSSTASASVLSAYKWGSDWDSQSTSASTSAKPNSYAMFFDGSTQNAVYNGPLNGTRDSLRQQLQNTSNWATSTVRYESISMSPFNVLAELTEIQPIATTDNTTTNTTALNSSNTTNASNFAADTSTAAAGIAESDTNSNRSNVSSVSTPATSNAPNTSSVATSATLSNTPWSDWTECTCDDLADLKRTRMLGSAVKVEAKPCQLDTACPGVEGAEPAQVKMVLVGDGLWDWVNDNLEKFKTAMTTDIAATLFVSEDKISDVEAALAAFLLLEAAPSRLLAEQAVDVSFIIASGASNTLTPVQLAQAYERAVNNGTANFSSTEAAGCPTFTAQVTGTGEATVIGQGTSGMIILAAIALFGLCFIIALACLIKKRCCSAKGGATVVEQQDKSGM